MAQGLKYIHDINLVHGNIKAVGSLIVAHLKFFLTRNQSNILITNGSTPRACLSGFSSISSLYKEISTSEASEASEGLKWRYLAPELIHPSKFGLDYAKPSRKTDIYGFGLLMLEVITTHYHVTIVDQRRFLQVKYRFTVPRAYTWCVRSSTARVPRDQTIL